MLVGFHARQLMPDGKGYQLFNSAILQRETYPLPSHFSELA